jgi:hypothetical protein
MRTLVLIPLAAVVLAAPAAAAKPPVVVAMHDPGCHWFYTGGGPNQRHYVTSMTRSGPVKRLNLPEATRIVKGPGGTKLDRVGKTLALTAKGTYRITMVKQAPDDNHLTLKVT